MLSRLKSRLEKPKTKNIILVGPPGSGKGTQVSCLTHSILNDASIHCPDVISPQAPIIKEKYSLCHLATGDLLRAAVAAGEAPLCESSMPCTCDVRHPLRAGTEMGKKAKAVMEAGGLVSDDIVVGIIKDNIKSPECSNGFILDGFPRTVAQAKSLDSMLVDEKAGNIDAVIEFKVPDQVLVDRICGRWIHAASGRSYHEKFAPPKTPGIDDITGEPLTRRKDDNADTLKSRLVAFHAQTKPVVDYYAAKGMYSPVDANQKAETVKAAISAILAK